MSDLIAKLNKALQPGAQGAQSGTFIHDNEAAILDAATKLLNKSALGIELLDFARQQGLALHVLKNKQDFGISPDQKSVFIACPAGQDMPSARAVLRLAGAIREAMHDMEGIPRPDVRMGKDRFVQARLDKAADIALIQTAVGYEIVQETGLLEIIDEIDAMGYRSIYEGYKADQELASPSG